MATRAELMAEAHRRGLLPPEQAAAFEEAVRRGLVGGAPREPTPAERRAARVTEGIDGPSRAMVQGLTFGYGDELAAGAAWLGTKGANAARRVTGQPIPYTADEVRDATLASER